MKNKSFLIATAALACLFVFSCKKPAGEGGDSSISGVVRLEDYNSLNHMGDVYELKDSYLAEDENVYIIYGDELGVGDQTDTGPGGKFQFKYLRPGTYRVYVESKDTTRTSVSGKMAVERTITLGKDDHQVLDTLLIFK